MEPDKVALVGDDDLDQLMLSHAAAVGKVAIFWNQIHDGLSDIFALIVDRGRIGLAAWHAVPSDRIQRKMLEAIAKERFGASSRFFLDLKWVLDQLEALEDVGLGRSVFKTLADRRHRIAAMRSSSQMPERRHSMPVRGFLWNRATSASTFAISGGELLRTSCAKRSSAALNLSPRSTSSSSFVAAACASRLSSVRSRSWNTAKPMPTATATAIQGCVKLTVVLPTSRSGGNAMRYPTLIAVILMLEGCVSNSDPNAMFSSVRVSSMGPGQYMVSCVDSPSYCAREANTLCPTGMDVVSNSSNSADYGRMTMIIKCR
jgi:hypothetical protein